MVEYDLQEQHNELPAHADGVLDPVTQEIKIELARLEQECGPVFDIRKEHLNHSLATLLAERALGQVSEERKASFYCRVLRLLNAVDTAIGVYGSNAVFSRHRKFLAELIADLREQRRQARALMVRAMRAVFNIPLFLDGPELSGYRHRLR
ncbi:hypothetical protein NPS29_11300 [Pseudomonas putida]|uniref:hypothetical protein n=1 Tax=Pseudomonas putida TaxID=303 RepID=UPI002363C20B|nr:hypothetical protein [Pseudomonas putida]MDD1965908.1 hypothetical protein [Pseudomonas putida]